MKLLQLLLFSISLLFLWSCEGEVKEVIKYVYIEAEPTSDESDISDESLNLGDADIVVSGTLAVTSPGSLSGLSLVSNSYSLNCVTFEDNPTAYSVAVVADGDNFSFSDKLENIAGISFGCFLLQGSEVLSPIVFSGESSLIAGSGKLEFDLAYNETSGSADAVINESTSSALDPEKVASAVEESGAVATDLTDFGGSYKFNCEAEAGMTCDPASIPSMAYFSPFTIGAKKKVAVWESKAKRDQCISGAATEKDPSFNMKIGTTTLPMSFTNTSTLNNSLDSAYGTLSGAGGVQEELATLLLDSAKQNESYKTNLCTMFGTASNCKYILGDVESYSYEDYYTKETVTYTYPKWYSNDEISTTLVEYAGTVSVTATPCSSHWSPDMDLCPGGTAVDEDGYGTYDSYFGTAADSSQKRLRLVCTDASGYSHQDWAHANNKTDALAAVNSAVGCADIASGSFAGEKEFVRNSVRNKLSEIAAMSMYRSGDNLCTNYGLPAAFSFTDCNSAAVQHDIGQLNYVYWETEKPSWIDSTMEDSASTAGYSYISYYSKDWAEAEFCRDLSWSLTDWGLQIDTGGSAKLIEADAALGPWEYDGRHLCPTYYSGYDYTVDTWDRTQCQNELEAMTAAEQIKHVLKRRIGDWDPVRYLACSDPTVKADFVTGMNDQCLPQAQIEYMCDNSGNCTSQLRCHGAKGGLCYNSQGQFVGRIDSRMGVMDLKEGVNGAFSLASIVTDDWMAYDSGDGGAAGSMLACKMTNETILNAKLHADDSIDAYYKERFKQVCEEADDSTAADGGAAGDPAGTNGGDGGQSAETIPETDMLFKISLDKCADDTCSS
jgi:hypothetical protein